MNLPSHNECIRLLNENKMPDNIVAHSLAVNRVAVFLAKKIIARGKKINLDLVDCGSLLHDFDKHLTFDSGNHGLVAKKMLEEKGFPQIALFCITHNLQFILENSFPSLEHKIVFYADKRIKGDQIVILSERLDYILERYGAKSKDAFEKISSCKKHVLILEKEILALAGTNESLEGLK